MSGRRLSLLKATTAFDVQIFVTLYLKLLDEVTAEKKTSYRAGVMAHTRFTSWKSLSPGRDTCMDVRTRRRRAMGRKLSERY